MPGLDVFGQNIWIADGPNVRDFGIRWTTRMTVVKLSDGSVWVDSPVPVPFATLTAITALGPVKYIVAATPRHVWRLHTWHTLFPDAQMWVARTTPFTLRRGRLPLAGVLENIPYQGWAQDLDQLAFRGNALIEEVLFFHRQSGTLILDDLIQNHPIEKGTPVRNVLFKAAGVVAPRGGVPLDIRLSFTNRRLARRSLETLLSWDFDKLIIGHGFCIREGAKAFVERAFRWLERR
jgi:hypothetical protein